MAVGRAHIGTASDKVEDPNLSMKVDGKPVEYRGDTLFYVGSGQPVNNRASAGPQARRQSKTQGQGDPWENFTNQY